MIFPGILLKSRHKCMYANETNSFPAQTTVFQCPKLHHKLCNMETCKQFILTGVFDTIIIQLFLKKSQEFFSRRLRRLKPGFKTPLIFHARYVKILWRVARLAQSA